MREYIVRFGNITSRIKDEYLKEYSESRLSKHVTSFVRRTPIKIETFHDLVVEIAELAYLNPDYMLFFRGQESLIRNRTLATLYPSIYRYELRSEIDREFKILNFASKKLVEILSRENVQIGNIEEIKRIKKMQIAILQHYEVCKTPYLDVTHSLRVACSFATNKLTDKGYIFVLALPYLTGRISVDSEDDITNMRLISICTNNAKRPFFQDGYLVGTEFTDRYYTEKNLLDFNNRLVAIYEFDNTPNFWGSNETRIINEVLYPENDPMIAICDEIKKELENRLIEEAESEDIGNFLIKWKNFEELIQLYFPEKNFAYSINSYLRNDNLNNDLRGIVKSIRNFRNDIVHKNDKIDLNKLTKYMSILEELINDLKIEKDYSKQKSLEI